MIEINRLCIIWVDNIDGIFLWNVYVLFVISVWCWLFYLKNLIIYKKIGFDYMFIDYVLFRINWVILDIVEFEYIYCVVMINWCLLLL